MFEKEIGYIKKKNGYEKAIKAFSLGMGKFPLRKPIDAEMEIIKNSIEEAKGDINKRKIETLLMFLSIKRSNPYDTTRQVASRFKGSDSINKHLTPAIEISNRIDDLIEQFLTPLYSGDDGTERYVEELKRLIKGDNMMSGEKVSNANINKVRTNGFFNSKKKRLESLIKEALELIQLYNSNNQHTKFSENHVERLASLYEELDSFITKGFIKKNINDSINIVNILKQIIQVLKNRDLEIDKKSLKALRAKEDYILKLQGKRAGSPFEVYHSAKNKITSIMDKGLKDSDSMLKISMLLDEMKAAYEEDNDTGGSGKLHIAECHKDFNEIQAYLDETPQMAQKRMSIDSIAEHAQQILDNYSQNDSELTKQLAEEGSEERKAQDSIISKAKHVNSSTKVDLSILFFQYVGYGGMIASFILGTYFIAYDIEYHLPKFYTSLGVTGVYIFSVLLMILIMGMIHIPLHSTVNNKWLKGSKKLLYFLLILGIPLKVFLDYRANVNYSNKVATANMVKDLNSSSSVLGLKNQQTKADIEARRNELKSFRDDLKAQKKLLQPYYKEQTRLENKIAMYEAKKRLTRNQRRDKKLAISKLEIVESNINRINREIRNIQSKINKTNGYIKDSQNSLISVIQNANAEKEKEAFIRKIFLIALTFMIELASLGGVFAGILINRNSKVDLESLHKYKQSLDTRTLVNSFLDRQTALNNEAYGAELEVRRHIARIGNARRLSDTIQHSQDIEMVAEVIDHVKQANSKLVGLAFRNGVLPNVK